MPLTNAGRDFIAQAIINDSPTFFNNANAYLGVGDSSVTFKSTFGSSEANFVWNEWGVFNAMSGGVMLSRKVESMGEKVSGSVWEDVTIELEEVRRDEVPRSLRGEAGMTCRHLAEGADWSNGGIMREFCSLSCEIEPNCDNCPDFEEDDE